MFVVPFLFPVNDHKSGWQEIKSQALERLREWKSGGRHYSVLWKENCCQAIQSCAKIGGLADRTGTLSEVFKRAIKVVLWPVAMLPACLPASNNVTSVLSIVLRVMLAIANTTRSPESRKSWIIMNVCTYVDTTSTYVVTLCRTTIMIGLVESALPSLLWYIFLLAPRQTRLPHLENRFLTSLITDLSYTPDFVTESRSW